MEVFEIVIALLLGGAVLAAISLQLRRAEGNGGNETEAEDAEVIRAAMAASGDGSSNCATTARSAMPRFNRSSRSWM